MSRLSVGDVAPDLVIQTSTGDPLCLSDLWRERPVLLSFLRHFG